MPSAVATAFADHDAGLTLTAALEHAIAIQVTNKSVRTGDTKQSSISQQVRELEQEIQTEQEPSSDNIQARAACLWAYLVDGNKDQVGLDARNAGLVAAASNASAWTNICRVKAAYFSSALLRRSERHKEAEASLRAIEPWLEANKTSVRSSPQMAYWAEQVTAELVTCLHNRHSSEQTELEIRSELRKWAVFAGESASAASQSYANPVPQRTKLYVWRIYYKSISDRIERSVSSDEPANRRELVGELKRVETAYEKDLMQNTKFPHANQSNSVVEQFVESVTKNWDIICGSGWTANDIGDGGRDLITRNVLDILYRATTKTFHSTLLLRKLFQVHKALAEFELAYHALDSYLELIERARARARKTGESQDQDPEVVVLSTMAEGILGLCSFGGSSEAARANTLCEKLDVLLSELDPSASSAETPHIEVNGIKNAEENNHRLPSEIVEIVHRAMGVGRAHWARWTPFNEHRSSLQSKAAIHLGLAVRQPLELSAKRESYFALALLLAQTRDVEGALDCVKQILEAGDAPDAASSGTQRRQLPFWHLLSLLLSCREDFATANQACLAAFEQFSSPDVLFGSRNNGYDSEKQSATIGLVDDMECAEMERILEVRLTELALTDLVNGPEDAVNGSNDLLVLYSRMFGKLGQVTDISIPRKASTVLDNTTGTVKSSKGSIFRRSKNISSEATTQIGRHAPSTLSATSRPTTRATQAPTIHVTDEDEKPSVHKHRLFHHSRDHSRKSRDSSESRREQSRISKDATEADRPQLGTIYSAEAVPQQDSVTSAEHNGTAETKQPLPPVKHNVGQHDEAPPPVHHSEQPPEQDTRLPTISPTSGATAPVPRYSRAIAQKHALTVLGRLWLTIAQLYREANMFEDSREATDEAAKAALKVETLVASTVESSARAFANPGWATGSKSSDECWADVYCERGELLLAIANARHEAATQQQAVVPLSIAAPKPVSSSEHDEAVREAAEMFEQCLMYQQTHLRGSVSLSNLLLDYYERKFDLTRRSDDDETTLRKLGITLPSPHPESTTSTTTTSTPSRREHSPHLQRAETSLTAAINGTSPSEPPFYPTALASTASETQTHLQLQKENDLKKTPENLNRLAARDRAYGLLSSLTKSGTGWDDSEAWFALARAHELGGETERAKEILWWVVSLEDTRPIRGWDCVNLGSYVL